MTCRRVHLSEIATLRRYCLKEADIFLNKLRDMGQNQVPRGDFFGVCSCEQGLGFSHPGDHETEEPYKLATVRAGQSAKPLSRKNETGPTHVLEDREPEVKHSTRPKRVSKQLRVNPLRRTQLPVETQRCAWQVNSSYRWRCLAACGSLRSAGQEALRPRHLAVGSALALGFFPPWFLRGLFWRRWW